jgi:hypothetical protein
MKPRLLVLLAILGLTAWCFGAMLFAGHVPGYRDTADFYAPLFRFEYDQWHAGRLPLWNPLSNLGQPLAATGTASVFYPAKLLFHLPLDFDWALRLYLVGHLLLAAGGVYYLARYMRASVAAAGIATLSYTFCANVLFQQTNVVFLVGAAWLPWAVAAALRMLREGSLRWAVALGAILALVVLGGDPQAAYHAGLLAVGAALVLWRAGNTKYGFQNRLGPLTPAALPHGERGGIRFWHALGLLTVAAVVGGALAAVQIVPSAEMAARSDRAASATARSLYEIPTALDRDRPAQRIATGLLCQLQEGTHHERVYRFSLAPWRLVEYVWPNVSGRQFPVHRRWLDALDGENRVWTPSLYMGLLPLALALTAFRLRRAEPLRVWLSWAVLVAVLASLGRFGLGWLAVHLCGIEGVGEPFAGLYWLLTVVLPGYIEFRYPAKLLVVAALGLSLLAALGWDQMAAQTSSRLRRWLLGLATISMAGAVVFLLLRPWWIAWLAGAEPDPLFGPLDTRGAANDVLLALVQTAVVAWGGAWLVKRASAGRPWVAPAALALVALDLAVANGWLAPTIRPIAGQAAADDANKNLVPPRAFRDAECLPEAWSASSSPERLEELGRWNRQTAAPYHHLTQRRALVEVFGTMDLFDYEQFCSVASDPEVLRGQRDLPARAGIDAERANALLELVGAESKLQSAGCKVQNEWQPMRGFPRAWIVHEVVQLPPIAERDPRATARRCVEVLQADGRPRDFRREAVVETERPLETESSNATYSGPEGCAIERYEPDCVLFHASLAKPGLVVLSDQFYPGWHLAVSSDGKSARERPILRTNRVMRGVWLPAGRHTLLYRYQPRSLALGAALSGLGLLLAGLLLCFGRRRTPAQ